MKFIILKEKYLDFRTRNITAMLPEYIDWINPTCIICQIALGVLCTGINCSRTQLCIQIWFFLNHLSFWICYTLLSKLLLIWALCFIIEFICKCRLSLTIPLELERHTLSTQSMKLSVRGAKRRHKCEKFSRSPQCYSCPACHVGFI